MADQAVNLDSSNEGPTKIRSSVDKSRLLEISLGMAKSKDIPISNISISKIIAGYHPNSSEIPIMKTSPFFSRLYHDFRDFISLDVVISDFPIRAIIASALPYSIIDERFLKRNNIIHNVVGSFTNEDISKNSEFQVTPLMMIDGENTFEFEFAINTFNSNYSRYGVELLLGYDYTALRSQINEMEQDKIQTRIENENKI